MKVVLLIETVSREIASKFILAESFFPLFDQVILGNTHEFFFQLLWFKHDVLFITNGDYNKEKVTLLKILKNRGVKIVLLENEGGVFKDITVQNNRLDLEVLGIIDLYFTWGELIRNYVVDNGFIVNDKVVVSGSPFFDTLRPNFKFVHKILNNDVIYKSKYILINTRFSIGNEFVKGQYSNFSSPEEVFFERQLMDYFVDLALVLSERYQIIFRPHPSEDISFYTEKFSGNKNILVTKENSAQSWILNCTCLVHNGCTTGIEGVIAGIKVISYMPINNPLFDMHLPNSVSIVCKSIEDIIYNIENESDFDFKASLVNNVTPYISNVLHSSIPIISNSIFKLLLNKASFNYSISFIDYFLIYKKAIISKIKHLDFYFFVVPYFSRFYIEHLYQESKRFGFFKYLSDLAHFRGYKIKVIGRYVFSLYK